MSWRSNIRDEIRSLPTPVLRSREGVCLDTNESPYGISVEASGELARHLAGLVLNRYPESSAERLRVQIAAELGVNPEGVVVGSGTEELTRLLCATFSKLKPRETRPRVAYPLPSPATYRVAVLSQGARPLEMALREGFELDLVAMERQITGGHPNLLLFSRPNDPTGNSWSREEMERAITEHPDIVVAVDESYVDYGGDTLLDLLPKNPHLVILRSLSKVGLAGLRVGFLVGDPELVAEVNKVRPEFSVSALVQEAALWLLQHQGSERAAAVQRVIAERERVATALQAIAEVKVFPSVTNFLLIQTPDGSGVARALRKRGISVADVSDANGPLAASCLRITVGLPEENDRLVATLPEAIAQPEPAPPVSRHKQTEVVAAEEGEAKPGLPKFF